MVQRRVLCLFFPCLGINRLQRKNPAYCLLPVAIIREQKGHLHIAALNAAASRAGIQLGMRLADARAILPTLDVVPDDPEADTQVKQLLIKWCNRYSPIVADYGANGIAIDITGCAHLFGGEPALLADIETRIHHYGYSVKGSIADTIGAAWALARYRKRSIVSGGEMVRALDPLPIEALRLPGSAIHMLRRVGLSTVAAVRAIARSSLAVRYGSIIVLRLDQALGNIEEPIVPYRLPAPYRAIRTLAEPVGTISAVQCALLNLLEEICSRLDREQVGARRLNLGCYRVDGSVTGCSIGTSKPVRSVTRLMRLFSGKLETIDAGFGIETLILSVSEMDRLDPVQPTLPHFTRELEQDTGFDEFIDRLGMRLGFRQVCRPEIREGFLPERTVQFQPVTEQVTSSVTWPQNRIRPVRLIEPPMHIGVSRVIPAELPVQFRIGRQLHRIMRAEGPERLTAEWWREESQSWQIRDYYRIEDDRGNRLWIFCERRPVSSSLYSSHWFLHGHLP